MFYRIRYCERPSCPMCNQSLSYLLRKIEIHKPATFLYVAESLFSFSLSSALFTYVAAAITVGLDGILSTVNLNVLGAIVLDVAVYFTTACMLYTMTLIALALTFVAMAAVSHMLNNIGTVIGLAVGGAVLGATLTSLELLLPGAGVGAGVFLCLAGTLAYSLNVNDDGDNFAMSNLR